MLPLPGTIRFAGYDWRVKTSEHVKAGPGPNYFSARGVRVDEHGLHLEVLVREGRVYCAEVISVETFGHGTYEFEIASDVSHLDRNLVFGMFTWSESPQYEHRELDVEMSRWGVPNNDVMQFTVQPATRPGNMVRFALPRGHLPTVHTVRWAPESIAFTTTAGGATVKYVVLKRRVPAGGENARMNLWSMGKGLAQDGASEVLIRRFVFTPLPARN